MQQALFLKGNPVPHSTNSMKLEDEEDQELTVVKFTCSATKSKTCTKRTLNLLRFSINSKYNNFQTKNNRAAIILKMYLLCSIYMLISV